MVVGVTAVVGATATSPLTIRTLSTGTTLTAATVAREVSGSITPNTAAARLMAIEGRRTSTAATRAAREPIDLRPARVLVRPIVPAAESAMPERGIAPELERAVW